MKKTLFSLAIALPVFGFSQLFNFNTDGDKQGWSLTNGNNTASVVAGGNYTIVKSTSANPFLSYSGTIDATTKKFVRVSLRNFSSFDKLNFRSDGSAATTANIGPFALPINEATSSIFKDYYIDLSTTATFTDWSSATETAMQLRFAASAAGPAGETIEINEIEFLDNGNKHEYNFDYAEQWTSLDGTIAVNSGNLVLTPTATAAKIVQDVLTVDATNNKYVHVFYKNNSPSNNQLRFQFKHSGDSYAAFKGKNQSISTAMSAIEETVIDMTTVPEWTGTTKNLQIILRNTNNGNTSSTDGTMEFDRIVINNSNATLSTGDINKAKALVQVYVAENKLNFRNANVTKATVFSMNGQVVKEAKVANNNIDISSLKSGVFIVKTTAQDGSETITKFVKK